MLELDLVERSQGRLGEDLNYRLPTEAEYFYAAAGTEGLRFPWGSQWDDSMVIGWHGNSPEAGSIPANASWCGALDMLSHEWSWCLDHYYPVMEAPGFNEDIKRMWDEAPREDPVASAPSGWRHCPVVKGWVGELQGSRWGDNHERGSGLGDYSDYVLRLVCAPPQKVFRLPKFGEHT